MDGIAFRQIGRMQKHIITSNGFAHFYSDSDVLAGSNDTTGSRSMNITKVSLSCKMKMQIVPIMKDVYGVYISRGVWLSSQQGL